MTKVKIRLKPISGNRQTIFLDYYPEIIHPLTGRTTRREFLKLFVYNEIEHEEQRYLDNNRKEQRRFVPVLDKHTNEKKRKLTEIERIHNKQTLALAEAIKAERQLSIQKGNYGFLADEKKNASFIDYFGSLADKRKGSNSDNWLSALQYFKLFCNGKAVAFKDLTTSLCSDFKDFLLTAPSRKSQKQSLSQNSALSYYNKFKAALKQAYRDAYLDDDLNKKVTGIKQADTERQFLTFEELQRLAETPCPSDILRRASLFSALTGLRFSDIQKLTWNEIQHSKNEGHYIRFRQKKTKGTETHPISEQAFSLLGKPQIQNATIFQGLQYSLTQTDLPKWVTHAGIQKQVTFHCFRHTYATLQLSFGTDLYTISKMLGHREIKTTQVYAKIIDKQKRQAADAIQLDL